MTRSPGPPSRDPFASQETLRRLAGIGAMVAIVLLLVATVSQT
jgi:hypothetical protein